MQDMEAHETRAPGGPAPTRRAGSEAAPTRRPGNGPARRRGAAAVAAFLALFLAMGLGGCDGAAAGAAGDTGADAPTDAHPRAVGGEESADGASGPDPGAEGAARAADSPAAGPDAVGAEAEALDTASATDAASELPGADDLVAPSFTRPEHVRGIYLNAWASGSRSRTEAAIELARRTEINTFVIDVKDATGFVSYRTGVELAHEIGADQELRILDVHRLLRRLEEEGIYPIARIVVFKDHLLAERRPDMAVQDSAGGPWIDGRGDVWVNPYDERVWAYHAELAREAVELGFPEIQWDYVRFPDRPQSELERAVFPGRGERTRSRAIRDFLVWSGESLADLDAPLTADVFGMATSARSDVGIGQLWEEFIDVVDAALPMIYPSHYWAGSFGIEEPNAHPYEIIRDALRHARERNDEVENPGRIIPWLQDFTLGPPRYEAAEVRAQILATYDAGILEWILWNSAGRYTEAALEPADGWRDGEEPWIRFGGEVVPAAVRLLPVAPEVTDPEMRLRGRDPSAGGSAGGAAAADTSSRGGGGSNR